MLYVLLAAVFCAADQALKLWVKANIALGGSQDFLPGVLGLSHVHNTGMAFSILSEHTWLLAIVSVAVIVGILLFLFLGKPPRWEKLALSMVLGGAAGNAVDRIFQGYVVDMFEVQFVRFAVFNLADVFIDVGAVLFCALYVVRTFQEEKRARLAAEEVEENGDDPDHGG